MKQFVLPILTILIISCGSKKDDPQPNQTTNTPPVTVNNNPPTLQSNLSYSTTTATQLSIDLSAKITDPENDTWNITTATANHGSVTISGTTINYTSNASYVGNDTITISIKDSKGATSIGKIAIVVSATTTNPTPKQVTENIISHFIGTLNASFNSTLQFEGTKLTISNTTLTANSAQSKFFGDNAGIATASYTINTQGQLVVNNVVYTVSEPSTGVLRLSLPDLNFYEFNK